MARQMTRQEPCTINGDVVVETLERHGYVNMAQFVRHLNGLVRDATTREDGLRAKYDEVVDRLHRYEPPPRYEPVSYQPPPESSD